MKSIQSRPSNQKIEQYYFEKFQKAYPFAVRDICYGDKPDIILTRENKKTGIEMVNFYREDGASSDSEQRQIIRRESVVKNAHALYLENKGRNVEFSFGFNFSCPITDEGVLSKKIAELAKTNDSLSTGPIKRETFSHIPELEFVYLNATEYEDPQWRITQSYGVEWMSDERLLTIIREKEEKALNGYERCNAYWLLVVVDFINMAQDQIIPESLKMNHSNLFEKILVYRTGYEQILEIQRA